MEWWHVAIVEVLITDRRDLRSNSPHTGSWAAELVWLFCARKTSICDVRGLNFSHAYTTG